MAFEWQTQRTRKGSPNPFVSINTKQLYFNSHFVDKYLIGVEYVVIGLDLKSRDKKFGLRKAESSELGARKVSLNKGSAHVSIDNLRDRLDFAVGLHCTSITERKGVIEILIPGN